MTADEIRKKPKDELDSVLNGLFREQFNLRMQNGSGKMSKSDRIKSVRRYIALIKTILNETMRAKR